jgi:hypothetical protein
MAPPTNSRSPGDVRRLGDDLIGRSIHLLAVYLLSVYSLGNHSAERLRSPSLLNGASPRWPALVGEGLRYEAAVASTTDTGSGSYRNPLGRRSERTSIHAGPYSSAPTATSFRRSSSRRASPLDAQIARILHTGTPGTVSATIQFRFAILAIVEESCRSCDYVSLR